MHTGRDEARCLGVCVFYLQVDIEVFVTKKKEYWVLMFEWGKFQAQIARVMIQNHIIPLLFPPHSKVHSNLRLSWSCLHLFLTQIDLWKQRLVISSQSLISKEKIEGFFPVPLCWPCLGKRVSTAKDDLIPFQQDFLGHAGACSLLSLLMWSATLSP